MIRAGVSACLEEVPGHDAADLHREPGLVRNSLDYTSWKDRKVLAAALRPVCTTATAEAAVAAALLGLNDTVVPKGGRRVLGPEVSLGGVLVAQGLGPGDSVLRIRTGGAPRDLHDQSRQEAAQPTAQDDQDPWSLP